MEATANAAPAATANTETTATSTTEAKAPQAVPGQKATDGNVTAKAEAKADELYEVKVNGQLKKYTLDQLRSKAGLSDAAMEKFEKASEMSKKSEAFKDSLKKDFLTALMDPELGLTKDQIRSRFESWYKENFIDPETMTDEQKELRDLKKYKEQKAKEEEERAEKERLANEEQLESHAREQLQKDIIQALDTSGLPKSRFTVSRMAYWMRQNLSKGFDAPTEVIIQQVKDERAQIVSDLISNSTAEQIVETLGEELINKLRKYDVERLKKRFEAPETTEDKPVGKRGERKTMADVDAYFNSLRRSKR